MDIRQLRTFVHVAELGNLRKASERLHTVQPALSRQIQLLEADLKVRLFDRLGRGMSLTAAGQLFLPRAAAILRQMEEARADMVAEAEGLQGSVSIGMPPSVAEALGARLAERLVRGFPQVAIRLVAGSSGYVLDWLQRGEVDLAILYDPYGRLDVQASPLLLENLFFVTATTSGFPEAGAFPFADLAGRRLILPSRRHGLRDLLEKVAEQQHLSLDVPIEADDMAIQKALVIGGLGDTVLPLAAVHRDILDGRLRAMPLCDPVVSRRLMVALPSGRPAANVVHRCVQELRAEVADMVSGGVWSGQLLDIKP